MFARAGGNFVDVVQPALERHGLYILLFLTVSLAALFFVSAVLIEIFMGSYEKVLLHTSEFIDLRINSLRLARLMKAPSLQLAAAAVGQGSLPHSLPAHSHASHAHNTSCPESFKHTVLNHHTRF